VLAIIDEGCFWAIIAIGVDTASGIAEKVDEGAVEKAFINFCAALFCEEEESNDVGATGVKVTVAIAEVSDTTTTGPCVEIFTFGGSFDP
jgi:hypothetical protein